MTGHQSCLPFSCAYLEKWHWGLKRVEEEEKVSDMYGNVAPMISHGHIVKER